MSFPHFFELFYQFLLLSASANTVSDSELILTLNIITFEK
jgi:hypothetical protein